MRLTRVTFICVVGVLSSASFVLSLLRVPFPYFPHFKYDLADVPSLIGAFTLGPLAGLAIVALRNLLNALVHLEPVGLVMNTFAGGNMVLWAGMTYRLRHDRAGACLGLAAGVVTTTLLMVPLNLVVIPLYTGLAREAVWAMMATAILPFNVTKTLLSSICTFLLYKRVSGLIPHPRPAQETLKVVKG